MSSSSKFNRGSPHCHLTLLPSGYSRPIASELTETATAALRDPQNMFRAFEKINPAAPATMKIPSQPAAGKVPFSMRGKRAKRMNASIAGKMNGPTIIEYRGPRLWRSSSCASAVRSNDSGGGAADKTGLTIQRIPHQAFVRSGAQNIVATAPRKARAADDGDRTYVTSAGAGSLTTWISD